MRFAAGKLSKLRLGYIGEKARATCCNIGKTGGDGRERKQKKGERRGWEWGGRNIFDNRGYGFSPDKLVQIEPNVIHVFASVGYTRMRLEKVQIHMRER